MPRADIDQQEQLKSSEAKMSSSGIKSAWPTGVACICFFLVAVLLFRAYGLLHWEIISHNYSSLRDPLKTDLLRLLNQLEIYHLTALFSIGFGA